MLKASQRLAALRESLRPIDEATMLVNPSADHFGNIAVGWNVVGSNSSDLTAFELAGAKRNAPYLALQDDDRWYLYPTGKNDNIPLFKDPSGNKWVEALNSATAELFKLYMAGKL